MAIGFSQVGTWCVTVIAIEQQFPPGNQALEVVEAVGKVCRVVRIRRERELKGRVYRWEERRVHCASPSRNADMVLVVAVPEDVLKRIDPIAGAGRLLRVYLLVPGPE